VNAFEQVAIGWQALVRSAERLRRPALWIPALVLGAVEWGVVALLCEFARPAVSWFMVPLMRRAGGDALLRYPSLYVALPSLFARADIVIAATLGTVVMGTLTLQFAAAFRGVPLRSAAAWLAAVRRAPALVLANLPVHVLLFAFASGVDAWLLSRGSGGLVRKLSGLIVAGSGIGIQALWFFVTSEIVLGGRGAFGAWTAMPRAALRGFWAALLISILSALALLPFTMLAERSATIVNRGVPELVAALTVAQIAVAIVRTLLVSGSAAMIYLALVEPHGEDRR
jgi:hypothetical protein